jgi:hypothetical protein
MTLELSTVLLFLIPVAFSCVHLLEFTAILARVSGIKANSNMIGFTIQRAVFVGTRFFIVLLLPMLGLIVDMRVSAESYEIMTVAALLGASVVSVGAFYKQDEIVRYYEKVIFNYKESGNFMRAFFTRSTARANEIRNSSITKEINSAWANVEGRKIIFQSMIVFAIYSTGFFISFYVALSNYEYRAFISQLSGVVNSIGTVLLTFFVEPRISRGIDAVRHDAATLVQALLIGRLLGVAILSQLILAVAFLL